MIVDKAGLVIKVEEARTLLGSYHVFSHSAYPHNRCTATAFVKADIFDEYTYTPPSSSSSKRSRNRRSQSNSPPPSSQTDNSDDNPEEHENVVFEIPLTTLIECLNIFGTAGPISQSSVNNGKKERKWRRADDDDEGGFGEERDARRGPIDNYFSGGKDEKRTGMRMSFAGPGYPLTLLM